jgi:23S rRNA (guanosine2251-2'-O)-methyltransferase
VKSFRYRQNRPKKNTLICGREAVIQALQEGPVLDRIYVQQNSTGPLLDDIRRLAQERLVPIFKVPVEKLNSFNVFNHEGCIAQKSTILYQDLQQIISLTMENGETPLMLVLDGITDIRNIGAMARSAYSFGAHAIIIPEKGVGALNEDAMLTSAGALEKLAICRVSSLHQAIDTLRLNGIRVYAADMQAATTVQKADLTIPVAFVLGGEEKGVQESVRKCCDASICIPMPGDFESLNVSVATGILLYETSRQRIG